MATHSELLEQYRTFSPLESRDKPMITELETKFAETNKQQVQQLATQLNTIHEQHRIYTDKQEQLKTEYITARKTKQDIQLAQHSTLARNKSYQSILATNNNEAKWVLATQITSVLIFLIAIYLVFWVC